MQESSRRLAVYGSLAPGEVNHHVLAELPGTWEQGYAHGEVRHVGWGTEYGFPALIWDPEGPRVPVQVFTSDALPDNWQRIDAFEGEDYERTLVPVEGTQHGTILCNIYTFRGTLNP